MATKSHSSNTPHPVADQAIFKRLIQQMNRALRDSHGGGIMERFEAVSKLLFTRMVDEREASGGWNGLPDKHDLEFCWRPGDSDRTVYERTRAIWQRAIAAYPDVFAGSRSRFPSDVSGVARIASLLDGVSLARTSSDVKGGAYEELLRNTFEKNDNQQYFTPRQIVDFMVDFCAPTMKDTVCDPAAGSGGFLVGVLAHVLMRRKPTASFLDGMRGAEIDERMAWIARINMLLHGGDPRSIAHLTGSGSLAPLMKVRPVLPAGGFSLILTNPPFGSDMTDKGALASFATGAGRSSRRRGILFVERSLDLLRPGGRLAIVLDESVLNLPSNTDVRELLRSKAIVEAVISLPDVAFMPYSTAKSSILVIRKRRTQGEPQTTVFMADVENVGNRPNGEPLYSDEYDTAGHRKLMTDLPAVLDLYRRFRAGDDFEAVFDGTTVFAADINSTSIGDSSRLDVFFFHPARQHSTTRLNNSEFPLRALDDLVDVDGAFVNPAQEYGDSSIRWLGLGDIEAASGRFTIKEVNGDRVKSNAHMFRPGDVLYSRLRPKLRKVVRIPDGDEGGFCSAELLVLRPKENGLDPDLLAYLLRSDLTFGQLIYQITGIGRPRVGMDAVRRLLLPVPPKRTQRAMLDVLHAADDEAARLRDEAHRTLEQARRHAGDAFERVLAELAPDHSGARSSAVSATGASSSARAAKATASA